MIMFPYKFLYFFHLSRHSVSRLMSSSAGGSMGHMPNMGGLGTCSVSDSKPMQFPLAQRRKRRVLFTQAQVTFDNILYDQHAHYYSYRTNLKKPSGSMAIDGEITSWYSDVCLCFHRPLRALRFGNSNIFVMCRECDV